MRKALYGANLWSFMAVAQGTIVGMGLFLALSAGIVAAIHNSITATFAVWAIYLTTALVIVPTVLILGSFQSRVKCIHGYLYVFWKTVSIVFGAPLFLLNFLVSGERPQLEGGL